MLLFKGGVLIYAEHCIYISIYIYIYIYLHIYTNPIPKKLGHLYKFVNKKGMQ